MNKYNARKTEYNGMTFDSRKELTRYKELELLERAGEISNLRRQVEFELIPKQPGERKAVYTADFVYTENGKEIVEDVKGMKTRDYIIRRKLMLWRHGIKIREV